MLYLLLLLALGCANYSKMPVNQLVTKQLDDAAKERLLEFKEYVQKADSKQCLVFLKKEADNNRLGQTFTIDVASDISTADGNYALETLFMWGYSEGKETRSGLPEDRDVVLDYLIDFMSESTPLGNKISHKTKVGNNVNFASLVASKCGVAVLEKLLQVGKDVDLNVGLDGFQTPIVSALMRADSDSGGPRRVELILNTDFTTGEKIHSNNRIKPDVLVNGASGLNAFMFAAHLGNVDSLRRMMKAEPNIFKKDIDGFNSVIYALMSSNDKTRAETVRYLVATGVPYTTLSDVVKQTLKQIIIASALAVAGGVVEQGGAVVGAQILTSPIGNFLSMGAKKALQVQPNTKVRNHSRFVVNHILASGRWIDEVRHATVGSLHKIIVAIDIQLKFAKKIRDELSNVDEETKDIYWQALAAIKILDQKRPIIKQVINGRKEGNIAEETLKICKAHFREAAVKFNEAFENYKDYKVRKGQGNQDTVIVDAGLDLGLVFKMPADSTMTSMTRIWRVEDSDNDLETPDQFFDEVSSMTNKSGYRFPTMSEIAVLVDSKFIPDGFYMSGEDFGGLPGFSTAYQNGKSVQVDRDEKNCSFFFVKGK